MKNSGWIDRDGNYYGVEPWGHGKSCKKLGFGIEEDGWKEHGWIKVSNSIGGLYAFAGRGNMRPSQAQIDRVYRWFKKHSLSEYDYEKNIKEFNYSYIDR